MKRIIASLVVSVSAFTGQAFALVGGPFDMGSHGAALDRNSVYQAVLSFNNGSGFCYFSPTTDITPRQGAAGTDFAFIGSLSNRTVIYYKGISYVGSCFGTADMDARFIEATLNATSELGFTATTQQQQQNGQQTQNTVAASNIIVQNSKSFLANGNFTGRITQTSPVLRFRGSGELAFVAPTGQSSVAGLRYQAYQGLIGAIISFISNSVVAGNGNNFGDIFTQAQLSIKSAFTELGKSSNSGGGIDDAYNDADVARMKVSGTRRYL